MDTEEIMRRLRDLGWSVTDVAVNQAGRFVKRVEHTGGLSVVMFNDDLADLATGRAQIEEIIERNKGADLADPWPVPSNTHRN
jgi:hypothetical protein